MPRKVSKDTKEEHTELVEESEDALTVEDYISNLLARVDALEQRLAAHTHDPDGHAVLVVSLQ
ncbi:MAG: hypothetical protein LC650_05245 [Actinobacteria bacterium]|nr:hypothetical protein [Actinomycetota bacterium]